MNMNMDNNMNKVESNLHVLQNNATRYNIKSNSSNNSTNNAINRQDMIITNNYIHTKIQQQRDGGIEPLRVSSSRKNNNFNNNNKNNSKVKNNNKLLDSDILVNRIQVSFAVRNVGMLTGRRIISNLKFIQDTLDKTMRLNHNIMNVSFETMSAIDTIQAMAATHIFVSVHGIIFIIKLYHILISI